MDDKTAITFSDFVIEEFSLKCCYIYLQKRFFVY